MKFNLRDKTVLIIVLTSFVVLLIAGVIINNRVRGAFGVFLERQMVFFETPDGFAGQMLRPMRELRQALPHVRLEQTFYRQVWQGIALSALVAMGIGLLAGVAFSNRITAPIRRLKEQINKLKKHHYADSLAVNGSDEIADLGQSFEELRLELSKIEELRKDVISDLAHEIVSPLQTLTGIIEGIEEGIYKAPDKLNEMKQAIAQVVRLTDDMRHFSHARAKQHSLALETIDLKSFCAEHLSSYELKAKKKKLKFEMAIEDTIELSTDPKMLGHILDNLVRNALQYTHQGSVEVRAVKSEGKVVIEVADTGIGISAQDLPLVFERFYRADRSRTRATGGTGLGLAIVKEYTDRLGWQVMAESIEGKGSTFKVIIPRA